MLIGELLSRRAHLTGEREAVLDMKSGKRYTFAAIEARAVRTAAALQDHGVTAGDRVALLAENGIAYLDLLFGAAKLGAIFVPLNWRSVSRELAVVLSDCEPTLLFYGPEYAGVAGELGEQLSLRCSSVDSLEEVSSSAPLAVPDIGDEAACCILYTSGTTGRPKGAMIPHRQVIANCTNVLSCWGVTESDVAIVQTPMFHTGGLFVFLLPLLYVGGRVVLSRGSASGDDLRLIERERCTVVLGVPTLFRLWQESDAFAAVDLSHVRFFISGGAPCPVSLMEPWRRDKGIVFRQGYGLTEVGPNCFTMTDEDSVAGAGSVGKPMLHSRARLVDANDRDVAAGEVGELLLAGAHVFAGYWRNSEATAAALRDGWFATGDMARVDEAGFFTIVGRSKDMLISGGENVYAAEVEAVARECPGVADAALVGEPHEKWGEVGVLAVCGDADLTEPGVLDYCAGKLARYKIPKRVVVLDDLPRSAYGKVLKAALKEQLGID